MTVKQRAEKGAELKASGACNCTLSVLKAFEDRLGLDENLLVKTAAGFAAGMGGLEGTCGAIVGAVIVAGFLTEGQGTPRISKSIVSKFNEKSGATICKDLKKITDGRPLCELNENSTLDNAAKYISNPKRQDLLFRIEGKLK